MKMVLKKLSVIVLVLAWILVGKIAKADELAAQNVQVAVIDLFDDARQRPVKILVWYPARAQCENARVCLADDVKLDQTAVLSHGAMGSAKEYNWIGYGLASQGIVTIGVNHFGESWIYGPENVDPSAVLRFYERPLDIHFVLSQLTQNQDGDSKIFNQSLNWHNVVAIGHSSGGATALSLVGAEFDFIRAQDYCATATAETDKSCAYLAESKPSKQMPTLPISTYTDQRIKRVVALDPALGHVVTIKSLNTISAPVLIVGSQQNDFLPYPIHAGFYAKHIENAKSTVLNKGEGHFVYLDKCDHAHDAMGISLCKDAQGVDREALHQTLYPLLFDSIFSR